MDRLRYTPPMQLALVFYPAGLVDLRDVGLVALETGGGDVAVVGSAGGLGGADSVVALGEPAVETFFGQATGRGSDVRGFGTGFGHRVDERRGEIGRGQGRHRETNLQNRPWKQGGTGLQVAALA